MSELPDIQAQATPEQLLAGLDAYINAANTMLDEGNMVDLAGLDAVVDILCARVLALDVEEGRPYAERFDVLNERLSALQEKMVATQTQLKKEVAESNKRQKASRAYLKESK